LQPQQSRSGAASPIPGGNHSLVELIALDLPAIPPCGIAGILPQGGALRRQRTSLYNSTEGKNQHSTSSIHPSALLPRPERKRIVAKVDELMKSCDELEELLKHESATFAFLAACFFLRSAQPFDSKNFLINARVIGLFRLNNLNLKMFAACSGITSYSCH